MNLVVECQLAHKVGSEDESSIEYAYEDRSFASIVSVHLFCQCSNILLYLFVRNVWFELFVLNCYHGLLTFKT